jgi:SAM-dependent methyltransferase
LATIIATIKPVSGAGSEPFLFETSAEAKRFAPATQRNRDAISAVLSEILPQSGTVLEVASGTGEHIVHFAAAFPHLHWQPSDYDAAGLASITAWAEESGLLNILPPIRIDASAADWPVSLADAIVCINMVHIAPWVATAGLYAGAARVLAEGAPLYLYGPYRETGVVTAESNEAFDASLKARNPEWGLRQVDDMVSLGAEHGFSLEQRTSMPANNLSLVFRKIAR